MDDVKKLVHEGHGGTDEVKDHLCHVLGSLPHSNSFRSQIPASRGAVPEMLAMCEALIAARLQAVFTSTSRAYL
jgi:hypothetical protein